MSQSHSAVSHAQSAVQPSGKMSAKVSAVAKATPNHSTTEGIGSNIADILDNEYRGVSLYTVAMGLLVVAILWTGVKTAQQVQSYHHIYGEMTKLKQDFRQLQIERQRMLIEQQTFSATPQVTNRAVTELNMFYPNLSDRMIIHDNKVVVPIETNPTTITDSPSDTAQPSVNLPIDPSSQH